MVRRCGRRARDPGRHRGSGAPEALVVIDGIIGDFSVAVRAQHTTGSYCVIAALVIIAAALIIAVGGRVMPLATDDADRTAAASAWPSIPEQATPAAPEPDAVEPADPEVAAAERPGGAVTAGVTADCRDRFRTSGAA